MTTIFFKTFGQRSSDSQLSMGMAYYFIYKMQASPKPKLKDGAY